MDIMADRPEYKGIFQYMVRNFEDPGKQTSKERFWVDDLENVQYPALEGPPADETVHFDTPEEAASVIGEFAVAAGADMVGFTRVTPEMVFKGADVKGKYAVSLGIEMDREAISTAPEAPAGVEALRAYWRLGRIVLDVARFIRYLGHRAQGHQVRTFLADPPSILHSLAAERAGLGEFGRLGILVTPAFGPRVRFGTVTTELPLPDEGPHPFGVDEFCSHCTICMDACRGNAIPARKSEVRGILKYTIDPYKCIPEFAKYDGCAICISVCPFNRRTEEMDWFLEGVGRLIGK